MSDPDPESNSFSSSSGSSMEINLEEIQRKKDMARQRRNAGGNLPAGLSVAFKDNKLLNATQIKVQLQKYMQYKMKGIDGGNSPMRVARNLTRTKSKLSHQQMLGIGVTAPKKDFMENFQLIAMNPKRHSSLVDMQAIETALQRQKLPDINKKKKLLIRNQSHFSSAMQGFANKTKKLKINQDDILVGDGDISQGSSISKSPKKNPMMGLQRMNAKKQKDYDRAEDLLGREETSEAVHILVRNEPVTLNNIGKITQEHCYDQIKEAFMKQGFDFRNRTSKKEIKKQHLIDVVEKAFDVRMTLLQATEAMMHSSVKVKQDDQEGSRPKNAAPTTKKEKQMKKINVQLQIHTVQTFGQQQFAAWLSQNLKYMHSILQSRFRLPAVSARKSQMERIQYLAIKQHQLLEKQSTVFSLGSHRRSSVGTASRNMDFINAKYNSQRQISGMSDYLDVPITDYAESPSHPDWKKHVKDTTITTNPETEANVSTNEDKGAQQSGSRLRNQSALSTTVTGHVSSMINSPNIRSKSSLINEQAANFGFMDYSCGDPYYNIKSAQKKQFLQEQLLAKQVGDAVTNLKRYPRLKTTVIQELESYKLGRESHFANYGDIGSLKSRQYLRDRVKKEEYKQKEMLRQFIRNEPKAYVANHLEEILKGQWSEEKNSFFVMSNIGSKAEDRVKNLIQQNRYSNTCVD